MAEFADFVKWQRYIVLEDSMVGREYYNALDKIREARSYGDVESAVLMYKRKLDTFLKYVSEDYPEFMEQAREVAHRWYDGLLWEAFNRIREIAEERLRKPLVIS